MSSTVHEENKKGLQDDQDHDWKINSIGHYARGRRADSHALRTNGRVTRPVDITSTLITRNS
jgi:hypothetical protein